jgi:hypothetical protein
MLLAEQGRYSSPGEMIMRRAAVVLMMLCIHPISHLHAETAVDDPAASDTLSSVDAENPGVVWIARFFGGAVVQWLLGRGLDHLVDRWGLASVGQNASRHLELLASQGGVSSGDRRLLREAAAAYRQTAEIMARRDLSDQDARNRILSNMGARLTQIDRQLANVETRIYALEVQQGQQHRQLVDQQGRILRLENQIGDLQGDVLDLRQHAVDQRRRTDSLSVRTTDLERIVYPDPWRYYRHGTYTQMFFFYADAGTLEQSSAMGLGISVQSNFSKWVGMYGDVAVIHLRIPESSGPAGSKIEWLTFPATVGLVGSILPPQSPISLQVSGGGGLSKSVVRYYPPDFNREDANWQDVTSISNVLLAGRIEIGLAPTLSLIEPTLGFSNLFFREPLAYHGFYAQTDKGRHIWYVSLGIRIRGNLPGDSAGSRP